MEFCEENKIIFTRPRAYRKNDQAHVEEKNGSVVRQIITLQRRVSEWWVSQLDYETRLREIMQTNEAKAWKD